MMEAMPAGTSPEPRISVVIPTFRRPALLARCLEALVNQTLPGDAYEVIVVDDGRTQDTLALCETFARRTQVLGGPAIRCLRPQAGSRGPAGARNRGWRAARARLIAFTDDDTLPSIDWLRQGEMAMAPGHRVAVWGRVHVPLPEALTDNARNTAGLENAVFVTANAFVRREALEAVGGFDERYLRAWREDTDLYFALLSRWPQDDAIAAAPQALVLHPVREAKFLVSIGQQANMAFDALLFKKYPALYDSHVGMRHPPLSYSLIALCTLAAALVWPASRLVAGGCAAAALLMIAGLAWRRLSGLKKTPRQIAEMLISSLVIPYASLYWRFMGAWRWRVPFY